MNFKSFKIILINCKQKLSLKGRIIKLFCKSIKYLFKKEDKITGFT